MGNTFQPMLAGEAPEQINFPVLASAKLDGIRCIVQGGVALSRSWKPLPNRHIQEVLGRPEFEGLDGEIIVGDVGAPDVYRKTNSAVMSRDGKPTFTWFVFDDINHKGVFNDRYTALTDRDIPEPVQVLAHRLINNQEELLAYESSTLANGLEGLILRDPAGPYKYGRSSAKQGWMLKLKRFSDSEAEIIGFQEEQENQNVATKDAFGRTERASLKENMVGKGTLGAFLVRDVKTGIEFKIGTGFDAADRANFWKNQRKLVGSLVKYKYFNNGIKEAPRFPVFIGFRNKMDM